MTTTSHITIKNTAYRLIREWIKFYEKDLCQFHKSSSFIYSFVFPLSVCISIFHFAFSTWRMNRVSSFEWIRLSINIRTDAMHFKIKFGSLWIVGSVALPSPHGGSTPCYGPRPPCTMAARRSPLHSCEIERPIWARWQPTLTVKPGISS